MTSHVYEDSVARFDLDLIPIFKGAVRTFLERTRFPSVPFRTHMIPEYFVHIYRDFDRHFGSGPCAFMHRLLIREK